MVNAVTRAPSIGARIPSYCQTLPRLPESVKPARRLVASSLQSWQLNDVEDAARYIVTELVANAVLHAQMPWVRLEVSRMGAQVVRIAVIDRSPDVPKASTAGPDDEHGRGLAIVSAMSAKWGVVPLRWGKRVYADVTCGQ